MDDMTNSHPQCRTFFAKLSEYIDNELDGNTCRSLEAHLRDCPPCQVCVATLKRTIALCRAAESSTLPESVVRRLRDMVLQLK